MKHKQFQTQLSLYLSLHKGPSGYCCGHQTQRTSCHLHLETQTCCTKISTLGVFHLHFLKHTRHLFVETFQGFGTYKVQDWQTFLQILLINFTCEVTLKGWQQSSYGTQLAQTDHAQASPHSKNCLWLWSGREQGHCGRGVWQLSSSQNVHKDQFYQENCC